jgi:FKBP-type peptidyl-prolyl cis-trans isomerase
MNKLLPSFLLLIIYCCDPPVQEFSEPAPDPVAELFVQANQYMHRRHQEQISAFVERAGWDAEVFPSGLWMVVEDSGKGKLIAEDYRVSYAYRSRLLDGTPCYESSPGSPKSIVVGKGGVERGVEEGLLHLRQGARAILLIPPHLAHGNFGDRNKIPGNTVLIYELEILEVTPGL